MPQTQKNREAFGPLCERFVRLMRGELKMTQSELARRLGYANGSTLFRVEKGETFPDVDRLQRLAEIVTNSGCRPNIDWLITGEGKPLIARQIDTGGSGPEKALSEISSLLDTFEPDQLVALEHLLRSLRNGK